MQPGVVRPRYSGRGRVDRGYRAFLREIIMTEPFFEHLRQHAVPLNETAIRQIRDSATGLDLYTWLAYRLTPRRSYGCSPGCALSRRRAGSIRLSPARSTGPAQ
jgi:hypothetical protein